VADVAAPGRVMPSRHQASTPGPLRCTARDHRHDFRDVLDRSTDTQVRTRLTQARSTAGEASGEEARKPT
jgi:hypothetical protein